MKGNRKPAPDENIQPDENYARELLQLFSIGQVLLNNDGTAQLDEGGVPLPAYNQTTIENFARVFTGWHFANGRIQMATKQRLSFSDDRVAGLSRHR